MRYYDPRRNWMKIVSEARKNLLREDESKSAPPERGNDSLDLQVDKFLANFESESKSSKNEGKDWRMTVRRLLEAEDDEKEEEAPEEDAPEEGDEDSDTEIEPEEPEKLTLEDIDINTFASSVARLVDNYDSLLEIRDIIVKRAANYLGKSYELDVVEKFKEILSEQFDMGEDNSPTGLPDEKFPAPTADRAFGSGGGGGA